MPLDGTVLSALASELKPILVGSRVEKIYQPEPDELVISFRHLGSSVRLLLSAHNQYPRVQVLNASKSNPAVPPVFCMLLRKHLTGSRLLNIEQPYFERMLVFTVTGTDELNQQTRRSLVVEMMGKHSNIILIDAETRQIIDSIKRIPLHISRKRQVLPGLMYDFPPSKKASPLDITTQTEFKEIVSFYQQNSLKNLMISAFNGISPPIAQEIIARASLDPEDRWLELTTEQQNGLSREFFKLQSAINNAQFKPILYRHLETDRYMDFSVIVLHHLEEVAMIEVPNVSTLLETYYGQKDHSDRLQQRSQDLRKTIGIKRNRLAQKLQNLHLDEEKALRASDDKMRADLIMSNIHRISTGQQKFIAVNYFDAKEPEVEILLNERKTAAQNAQELYKRYQKSKTALIEIARQKTRASSEIMYLDQILLSIEQADSLQDLDMVRGELVGSGYLKAKPSKLKKNKALVENKPLSFYSSHNQVIRVGKNNLQNDQLTFKLSKKTDLWFHAKDLPGSHVVLSLDQKQPASEEIIEAATLAAYYSKGRLSSKVPVDYTWCRYVKKQRGALPGMVIYQHQQTIYVTPSESVVNKIASNKHTGDTSV